MNSQTSADSEFAKLVLETFKRNLVGLEVEVRESTPTHVDYEVRIPSKGKVGFRAVVTTVSTPHTEYDPDPRSFGDPHDVVQRAMQDWYPGKATSWTETRRTFVLMAWNLPNPALPDYTASFEYSVGSLSKWSPFSPLEEILRLIEEKIATQAHDRRKADEESLAAKVTAAFKDL